MLALSDQQLVTGLAVLFASYTKICSMPIYYFNIVASLAWFSSATHLATLGVLRIYLVDHRTVRGWRVSGMMLLLLLLIVALLPGWDEHYNSVPISCAYMSLQIESDFPNIATIMTTFGFLIIIYTERIARLFSNDGDWNMSDTLIEILVKLYTRETYWEPTYKQIARGSGKANESNHQISSMTMAERERVRFRRFERVMRNSRSRLKLVALATYFMSREISYSFLDQISILVFDLTYGFAQTIMYRTYTPTRGIDGDQNEMGFGQLVPLFLLLLPALAVGEIYFGKCYSHEMSRASINLGCNKEGHDQDRDFEDKHISVSTVGISVNEDGSIMSLNSMASKTVESSKSQRQRASEDNKSIGSDTLGGNESSSVPRIDT